MNESTLHREPAPWDRVFLDMAFAIAKRSKDPSTQCGAVLVNSNNVILSCGFNGPPTNLDDSVVPWTERPAKYNFIIHAEENALLFALEQHGSKVERSTMYLTHYPCSHCVLRLIRSKVSRVIIPRNETVMQYRLNYGNNEVAMGRALLEAQVFPKLDIQMVDYVC